MKKKVLATVLLSTVVLSSFASVTEVFANDTDSQIATQNEKINTITEQQASAQAQVDQIQSQVDSILAEQEKLTSENNRLEAESQALAVEIERLSGDIVSRDAALKEQARSVQTDGSATSYINTILDSKSIVDAVSRVNAMREIIAANNRMLEQQKEDKQLIAEKQKINQEAINTVIANKQKLSDDEQALKVRQAELEAAKLTLAAEKATAESEKAALLEQKAAAEAAAIAAAQQEQAYQQQQAAAQVAMQQSAVQVVQQTSIPATSTGSTTTTTASTTRLVSSGNNTYPVGQCTWGAKELAPWVGNYWGNAGQWLSSARAAGFSTGTTPQVGAVAVWTNSYYGHVAVVTAVNGNMIQVSECNYDGSGTQPIANYRGWFTPSSVAGYIYP